MAPETRLPDPSSPNAERRNRVTNLAGPVLGTLLSLLFVWLAFRDTSLAGLMSGLQRTTWAPLAGCILIQIACQFVRIGRWGLMMRRLGEISWRRILDIGAVGLAAVAFFPIRLGELVRPALVAEDASIDFAQTAATVVAERLIDGLIMSLVFFASFLALGSLRASGALVAGATLLSLAFVCALIFLAVGERIREQLAASIRATVGRISRNAAEGLVRSVEGFFQALRLISSRRILGPYVGLSMAMWGLEAATLAVLFAILPHSLPAIAALVVLSALVIGTIVPAGPAHLGVFEFAAFAALRLFDIEPNSAAFYASLLHVVEIAILLIFGLYGVWGGRFQLSRMLRQARRAASHPPDDNAVRHTPQNH